MTSKPPSTADLLGLDESATNGSGLLQHQFKESIPEVLYFDYGVVVIWGMSEQEEVRLLQELARFEEEKLGTYLDNWTVSHCHADGKIVVLTSFILCLFFFFAGT